ncbi:hypothetical protein DP117_14930 [Brasilonema sp. UFV-L1]|nr:hypothetical protein [Brasilonema sp. UFV-L1]
MVTVQYGSDKYPDRKPGNFCETGFLPTRITFTEPYWLLWDQSFFKKRKKTAASTIEAAV